MAKKQQSPVQEETTSRTTLFNEGGAILRAGHCEHCREFAFERFNVLSIIVNTYGLKESTNTVVCRDCYNTYYAGKK